MQKITTLKIVFIPLFTIFLVACDGGQKESKNSAEENTETNLSDEDPKGESTKDVDPSAKAHVNEVLEDYYTLKAALADDNSEKAQTAGEKLFDAITSFDATTLQEDMRAQYSAFSEKIQQYAENVSEAKDITVQRENFVHITDGVYQMVKTTNANDEAVYYTYCPMAFDNTGGYWLSKEKEVRNPYFGSKMLKCGSVKETIAENQN